MFYRNLALTGLLALCQAATAQDVDYRLPSHIVPTAQHIHLELDPAVADYTGSTTISIRVGEDSDRIGVYQLGLELSDITLSGAGTERSLDATAGDWDINWLADGETIPAGEYELSIDFSGSYSTDALGMHRVRFEDRNYVFTQMEAMYARRAFPLFDEPFFKLPYRMTITAPEGLTVLANTPVESTSVSDGMQAVTFMETPPLPSYLLAYAVGPLDRAPIEGLSVPGYIYVPKGHADELGFVLRETPGIVAALEDYFGSDYPFRKLDFVAVPEFAFGAMENPGLITYRTDLMMVGDEVSGATAETVLMVIAHEVAHIWYGDVVTMEWWNDLWLNEAFASWMAWSTIERLYPEYDPQLKLPQAQAFGADQQVSVKPIRRVVRNNEEITDGLGLNYTKGHAILRMLERYVGPDIWREAIQEYIRRYAWQNATEADLWAVITEVSGLDVGKIAGDYLNQPGFPIVSIAEDGSIAQERYLLPGTEAPDLSWLIPMNIKYKADGDIRQTFYLLDAEEGGIDLPADADWVFPDAGGNGYFRWATDMTQFFSLLDDADALSNREKIALLDNAEALFNANRLTLADYLFVLDRMLSDPYPLVFLPTLERLKAIGDNFVDDSTAEAFESFVDESLSARFADIGAEMRPGDSEALVQMRPRLIRMLGEYGSDPGVRAAARDIAGRFLEDPASVETNLAREALRITALYDDGGLYDDYIDAYRRAPTANQKTVVLGAIYFDDPAVIERHLDFSLTDEVAAGDAVTGIGLFAAVLDDNTPVYTWLADNLDALNAKMPAYYAALMPQVIGGGCSEASLERLNEFFGERGEQYAASLAKANESARACISRKARHQPDLATFLEPYSGD